MYKVTVYDYFSSAHQLNGYNGKCENIHGHNWKVELELIGEKLDDVGMLVDFTDVKSLLKNTLAELDHKMLNDLEPFKDFNPSSELIAKYLYNKFKLGLPSGVQMHAVHIWESERSKATYFEE